jgi:hypothetical protein
MNKIQSHREYRQRELQGILSSIGLCVDLEHKLFGMEPCYIHVYEGKYITMDFNTNAEVKQAMLKVGDTKREWKKETKYGKVRYVGEYKQGVTISLGSEEAPPGCH